MAAKYVKLAGSKNRSNDKDKQFGAKKGNLQMGALVSHPIRRLVSFGMMIPGCKLLFIGSCLLAILSKLVDIFPPLVTGWLIDSFSDENPVGWIANLDDSSKAVVFPLVYFVASAVGALTQYAFSYCFIRFGQTVTVQLTVAAYAKLQSRELFFFESNTTGNIMTIVSGDVEQVKAFLMNTFPSVVNFSVEVVSTLAVTTSFGPIFLLFVMTPVAMMMIINFWFQRALKRRQKKVRSANGILCTLLQNNISGIAVIKSFCTETMEMERIQTASVHLQAARLSARSLGISFGPTVRIIFALAISVAIAVGFHKISEQTLKIGQLTTIIILFSKMIWPMSSFGQVVVAWTAASVSSERLFGLIDSETAIATCQDPNELPTTRQLSISFDNVFFVYKEPGENSGFSGEQQLATSSSTKRFVLRHLTFQVPAGRSCGLAGSTGAGKSTILKLLLRFYDVDSGTVSLGGCDVRGLSVFALRSAVALVSQETYLFDGTIQENISYSNGMTGSIELDRVVAAAKIARLHEFVCTLPNGYDTVVGERGVKLSGGQRQRLAIARAVLKDAPVLALDEATASVDSETEQAIQTSLVEILKHRTSVVVAHRLGTLRSCDNIMVIHEGTLAEQGSHDHLVNVVNGIYSRLWAVQTGQIQQSQTTS